MQKALIYILAMMMAMMALTACSSSDSTEEPKPQPQQPTMLTIYVYSPEHPIMTRGDVGPVDATTAENKVTQLQIWVYDTSGNKVGYLSTTETATLNGSEGATYQIPVPDDFAQNKPNVDVYVMANITYNNTFTETTSRSDLLDNAKIPTGKYGLSPKSLLITAVPTEGLPMAGELLNQPVIGDAPVLRIGTTSNIATVPLTRAVSKLRFVFANTTGSPTLSITDITLNEGMIPNEEYLFPQSQSLTYNSTAASLLTTAIADVTPKDNPTIYVYNGQTAQAYEELLNGDGLTQTDPIYLRESDKKIEGTISYTVDGTAQTPVTFRMKEPGDFLRNHSWIVYAYYEGLSGMQVVTVDVTPWEDINDNHTVYNW